MNKLRKNNFDYLRVLAMIYIIAHHCIINDLGLQTILKNHTYAGKERLNEVIILGILNSCSIIGVNIFFLLSGFFKINFKWKKLIGLIIKTYIIYGIIAVLGLMTGNLVIDFTFIKNILDPLDMYWFIMTYILLYIASPLLNIIIENISYSMSKKTFIGIVMICCGYGFIFDVNLHINKGYSFLMAMALYIIGGIIEKRDMRVKSLTNILIAIVCILVNTIGVVSFYILGYGNISWKIYSYNNPLVLTYSVAVLLIFINVSGKKDNKLLTNYAMGTLTVYMIHSTCWLSEMRAIPLQYLSEEYGFLMAIFCLPIYVVIIYTIGIAANCIYERFANIYVKRAIEKLLDKIRVN